MLTGTHEARVSDHGLTTFGSFRGVSGYSAPEITDANWVSQEADVYSFGVLLLELLTRKVPFDRNTQLEDRVDLPRWVCSVAHEEWAAKVIDAELLARQQKDGEEECMVRFLLLAVHCCSKDAKLRPTMSDVVQVIEEITT
jgi:serine/threonine protein kinase